MWRKWQVNITQVFLNKLPTGISFLLLLLLSLYRACASLAHILFSLKSFYTVYFKIMPFFSVLFHLFSTNKFMYTKSHLIYSHVKKKTPYWIPWFSVSGHNNNLKKIIWSLAGLKFWNIWHITKYHYYLTKTRTKWKSHGWQTKDTLTVILGMVRHC